MADNQTPAGWYPDPSGDATKMRYWDGNNWTDDYQDMQAFGQPGAIAGYAATTPGTETVVNLTKGATAGYAATTPGAAPGAMPGANYPGTSQMPGTPNAYNPYASTGQPVAPVSDKSGFAIAALVLGIVGAALGCFVPIIGVVGGILGVVFGTIGRKSSKQNLATVGLILGIVSIVLGCIFWIIWALI